MAFLLDVSGSMALLGKIDRAKEAIRLFAGSLLPEDEVALLIFADGQIVVKLRPAERSTSRAAWYSDA